MSRLKRALAGRDASVRRRQERFPTGNGLEPFMDAILQSLLVQPISDAYWSVTNPIDRLTSQGRASEPMMGIPLGGKWAPSTPGVRLERARPGDLYKDYKGQLREVWKPARIPETGQPYTGQIRDRIYNLVDETSGMPRATIITTQSPKSTFVNDMWVDEDLRTTSPAFFDLGKIALRGGRDVEATFANERLKKVVERFMNKRKTGIAWANPHDIIPEFDRHYRRIDASGRAELVPLRPPTNPFGYLPGRADRHRRQIRDALEMLGPQRRHWNPRPGPPEPPRRRSGGTTTPQFREMMERDAQRTLAEAMARLPTNGLRRRGGR